MAPIKGNTIQEQWEEYYSTILKPAGAGAVQVRETKRAFYAASYAMLTLMMNIACEEVSEEAGDLILRGWQEEYDSFVAMMEDGVA